MPTRLKLPTDPAAAAARHDADVCYKAELAAYERVRVVGRRLANRQNALVAEVQQLKGADIDAIVTSARDGDDDFPLPDGNRIRDSEWELARVSPHSDCSDVRPIGECGSKAIPPYNSPSPRIIRHEIRID
jgi:hypothetical protein